MQRGSYDLGALSKTLPDLSAVPLALIVGEKTHQLFPHNCPLAVIASPHHIDDPLLASLRDALYGTRLAPTIDPIRHLYGT